MTSAYPRYSSYSNNRFSALQDDIESQVYDHNKSSTMRSTTKTQRKTAKLILAPSVGLTKNTNRSSLEYRKNNGQTHSRDRPNTFTKKNISQPYIEYSKSIGPPLAPKMSRKEFPSMKNGGVIHQKRHSGPPPPGKHWNHIASLVPPSPKTSTPEPNKKSEPLRWNVSGKPRTSGYMRERYEHKRQEEMEEELRYTMDCDEYQQWIEEQYEIEDSNHYGDEDYEGHYDM